MQDCLNQFTEATEDDTNLGLSTISSIYSRELTFTTDKNSVETAINNLECEGLTSLYQSLYSSVLYTATATGSRCVVAFTDGMNVPYGSGYDYDEDDESDSYEDDNEEIESSKTKEQTNKITKNEELETRKHGKHEKEEKKGKGLFNKFFK